MLFIQIDLLSDRVHIITKEAVTSTIICLSVAGEKTAKISSMKFGNCKILGTFY